MSNEVVASPFKKMLSEFDRAVDAANMAAIAQGRYRSGHHARTLTDKAIEMVEGASKEARALLVEVRASDVSAAGVIGIAGSSVEAMRTKLVEHTQSIGIGGSGIEDLLARFDDACGDTLAVVKAVLRPENLARLANELQRPPIHVDYSVKIDRSTIGDGNAIGVGAVAVQEGLTAKQILAFKELLAGMRQEIERADLSDAERSKLVAAVEAAAIEVDRPGSTFAKVFRPLLPVARWLGEVGTNVAAAIGAAAAAKVMGF
jgi:hypothetical protein